MYTMTYNYKYVYHKYIHIQVVIVSASEDRIPTKTEEKQGVSLYKMMNMI